jgi:hypothetical protein
MQILLVNDEDRRLTRHTSLIRCSVPDDRDTPMSNSTTLGQLALFAAATVILLIFAWTYVH